VAAACAGATGQTITRSSPGAFWGGVALIPRIWSRQFLTLICCIGGAILLASSRHRSSFGHFSRESPVRPTSSSFKAGQTTPEIVLAGTESRESVLLLHVSDPRAVLTLVSANQSGASFPVIIEASAVPPGSRVRRESTVETVYGSELPRLRLLSGRTAQQRVLRGRRTSLQPAAGCSPSERRRFLVPRMIDGLATEVPVLAELTCVGRHVAVYVAGGSKCAADDQLAGSLVEQVETSELLDAIGRLIHPLIDVDNDGHLTIVLSDIDDRITEGCSGEAASPVRGCVRPDDWMRHDQGFSGDIIYLDRRLSATASHMELLTHELTHAAICSAGIAAGHDRVRLPNWLNEAIAHTSERALTAGRQNLNPRLSSFLRDTAACPIIPDTQLATLATRRGGPRAAAATFVDVLLSEGLTLSQLAQPDGDALEYIQQRSERSFAELLTRWAAAVTAETCLNGPSVSEHGMFVRSVAPDSCTTHEIHGTAMLALRPMTVPCRLRITSTSEAKLSAICVIGDLPARDTATVEHMH